AAQAAVNLTGAGATFPYPLYSRYFAEFHRRTGVAVNYQSIGSGGGLRQLRERTVHFGASDAYLTDEQMARYPGPVVHIPTAIGAVVPAYQLPGVKGPLRFSGPVLAGIFLGKVKRWDDPAIQQLNPQVRLPGLPITVVHRSDGSGTTFVWVEYLAKVSPQWARQVGVATSVAWPTGLGAKGNEGVAGVVRQTPGAIGYLELAYAVQNGLSYGAVQNQSGQFVVADLQSLRDAANIPLPADTRVSLTNTPAPGGYPVASFTWLLVYRDLELTARSRDEAAALVRLLDWVVHEGQEFNEALHYGRLPAVAVQRAQALIAGLRYRGEPLGARLAGRRP
ncbi:MAG TPA: phosphate ABC transporter substrate-binding protein PstS, partial [Limnochordales bacterium]